MGVGGWGVGCVGSGASGDSIVYSPHRDLTTYLQRHYRYLIFHIIATFPTQPSVMWVVAAIIDDRLCNVGDFQYVMNCTGSWSVSIHKISVVGQIANMCVMI